MCSSVSDMFHHLFHDYISCVHIVSLVRIIFSLMFTSCSPHLCSLVQHVQVVLTSWFMTFPHVPMIHHVSIDFHHNSQIFHGFHHLPVVFPGFPMGKPAKPAPFGASAARARGSDPNRGAARRRCGRSGPSPWRCPAAAARSNLRNMLWENLGIL